MIRGWAGGVTACLLVSSAARTSAITVELSETLTIAEGSRWFSSDATFDDDSCDLAGLCHPALTRDGSFDLDSRYGCTEPVDPEDPPRDRGHCYLEFALSASTDEAAKIAGIKIALHPDSVAKLQLFISGGDDDLPPVEWEGAPGSVELQEVTGLEGAEGTRVLIGGIEPGGYLGIVEIEIYVEVDEVEPVGASASTRATISATATTDTASAMNTLDGDATDASSWSCSSGEVCEITYDLEAVESLEQLRIAFAESTSAGGELHIMAAAENGVFSSVRTGLKAEAGGRPLGSDGLQTFGGVRALARYVRIEAVPAEGGSIGINEVDFRVGETAPARPVAEKAWLKPTGMLPLGKDPGSSFVVMHDARDAAVGGCDSPAHFDGCHVYYIKDGDESEDSRWSCGPAATGGRTSGSGKCIVEFSLNEMRYVRQIQLAFYLGDEQHDEFSIEAYVRETGWATVVPSAITSGDTTSYQTFDLSVHTGFIQIVPKFQRYYQWINIKEMVILERRKNAFVAGTLPVLAEDPYIGDPVTKFSSNFKFDIAQPGDDSDFSVPFASITALRMRFPANRRFVFEVDARIIEDQVRDFTETFTNSGSEERGWETFTLSEPIPVSRFRIIAVEGPDFGDSFYPTLRVADFQVVGETIKVPGHFDVAATTIFDWGIIPDIIGDGVSEQQEIMTAICESKGSTFDGTDCVGELDNSLVSFDLVRGDYYFDGPILMKSGVTLEGGFSDDFPNWAFLITYDGPNTELSSEEALIVIDGVTNAEVMYISMGDSPNDDVPVAAGSFANFGIDVKDSQDLRFTFLRFAEARLGGARLADSKNITWGAAFSGEYETGNFLELTRVDDLYFQSFPEMNGLLIDTCTNLEFDGVLGTGELDDSAFNAPTGGEQVANVVITGASSGIVFNDFIVGPGAEPRILMESTEPLTLEGASEVEDAVPGDCIIQVPEGTTSDLIVQIEPEVTFDKSGDCWVLV